MSKIVDYESYLVNLFSLLDKYLVTDLETLVDEIPDRPNGGGVGYPTFQTLLAGMELLGLILSGNTQSTAFQFYWDNHLCKMFPQYAAPGLSEIFNQVGRNGTAHLFLVKTGISLTKKRTHHLEPSSHDGRKYLNIDLVWLRSHFVDTYNAIKDELLNKPLTPSVKCGCDQFQSQMDYADGLVQKFLSKRNSVVTMDIIAGAGASGTPALF